MASSSANWARLVRATGSSTHRMVSRWHQTVASTLQTHPTTESRSSLWSSRGSLSRLVLWHWRRCHRELLNKGVELEDLAARVEQLESQVTRT